MTTALQAWIALIGGFATAFLGIFKYFNYRSRRDRLAIVGQSFRETVEALSSQDEIKRLAAAILLRRFFDPRTEQGGDGAPYQDEAVRVIAALLRATETGEFQKLLADGLAYAPSLRGADLQRCNLQGAYLGDRRGRGVDLSDADLYRSDLTGASLKGATARNTAFYRATLTKTVFEGADLSGADLRKADLSNVRLDARTVLAGARFAEATNVPEEIAARMDGNGSVA
jgi:pentapeptide repeat protein